MTDEIKANGSVYLSIPLSLWREYRNEAIVRLHEEWGFTWQMIAGLKFNIGIQLVNPFDKRVMSTLLRHTLLAMYPQLLLLMDWPHTQPWICDRPFGKGLTAGSIARIYRSLRGS